MGCRCRGPIVCPEPHAPAFSALESVRFLYPRPRGASLGGLRLSAERPQRPRGCRQQLVLLTVVSQTVDASSQTGAHPCRTEKFLVTPRVLCHPDFSCPGSEALEYRQGGEPSPGMAWGGKTTPILLGQAPEGLGHPDVEVSWADRAGDHDVWPPLPGP